MIIHCNNMSELQAAAYRISDGRYPDGLTLDINISTNSLSLQPIVDISGKYPENFHILFNSQYSISHIQDLAKVLSSGLCPKGFTIELYGNANRRIVIEIFANVITSGKCPQNFKFRFKDLCGWSEKPQTTYEYKDTWDILINALKTGKCPRGLSLELKWLRHREYECPLSAISSSNCPSDHSRLVHDPIAKGFADALSSGKCPENFSLDLSENELSNIATSAFCDAIRYLKCPSGFSLKLNVNLNTIDGFSLLKIKYFFDSIALPILSRLNFRQIVTGDWSIDTLIAGRIKAAATFMIPIANEFVHPLFQAHAEQAAKLDDAQNREFLPFKGLERASYAMLPQFSLEKYNRAEIKQSELFERHELTRQFITKREELAHLELVRYQESIKIRAQIYPAIVEATQGVLSEQYWRNDAFIQCIISPQYMLLQPDDLYLCNQLAFFLDDDPRSNIIRAKIIEFLPESLLSQFNDPKMMVFFSPRFKARCILVPYEVFPTLILKKISDANNVWPIVEYEVCGTRVSKLRLVNKLQTFNIQSQSSLNLHYLFHQYPLFKGNSHAYFSNWLTREPHQKEKTVLDSVFNFVLECCDLTCVERNAILYLRTKRAILCRPDSTNFKLGSRLGAIDNLDGLFRVFREFFARFAQKKPYIIFTLACHYLHESGSNDRKRDRSFGEYFRFSEIYARRFITYLTFMGIQGDQTLALQYQNSIVGAQHIIPSIEKIFLDYIRPHLKIADSQETSHPISIKKICYDERLVFKPFREVQITNYTCSSERTSFGHDRITKSEWQNATNTAPITRISFGLKSVAYYQARCAIKAENQTLDYFSDSFPKLTDSQHIGYLIALVRTRIAKIQNDLNIFMHDFPQHSSMYNFIARSLTISTQKLNAIETYQAQSEICVDKIIDIYEKCAEYYSIFLGFKVQNLSAHFKYQPIQFQCDQYKGSIYLTHSGLHAVHVLNDFVQKRTKTRSEPKYRKSSIKNPGPHFYWECESLLINDGKTPNSVLILKKNLTENIFALHTFFELMPMPAQSDLDGLITHIVQFIDITRWTREMPESVYLAQIDRALKTLHLDDRRHVTPQLTARFHALKKMTYVFIKSGIKYGVMSLDRFHYGEVIIFEEFIRQSDKVFLEEILREAKYSFEQMKYTPFFRNATQELLEEEWKCTASIDYVWSQLKVDYQKNYSSQTATQ